MLIRLHCRAHTCMPWSFLPLALHAFFPPDMPEAVVGFASLLWHQWLALPLPVTSKQLKL